VLAFAFGVISQLEYGTIVELELHFVDGLGAASTEGEGEVPRRVDLISISRGYLYGPIAITWPHRPNVSC